MDWRKFREKSRYGGELLFFVSISGDTARRILGMGESVQKRDHTEFTLIAQWWVGNGWVEWKVKEETNRNYSVWFLLTSHFRHRWVCDEHVNYMENTLEHRIASSWRPPGTFSASTPIPFAIPFFSPRLTEYGGGERCIELVLIFLFLFRICHKFTLWHISLTVDVLWVFPCWKNITIDFFQAKNE